MAPLDFTNCKKPYPLIDPTQAHLSCANKTVLITGASGLIGKSIATAFARANARQIILLGRNKARLEALASSLNSPSSNGSIASHQDTSVSTYTADLTSRTAITETLSNIARTHGPLDILIHNAGSLASPEPIPTAKPDAWWDDFETNVRGTLNVVQGFLPHAAPGATIIGVNAGFAHIPARVAPGLSAYVCSKVAAAKMLEFVAQEAGVRVTSVHPGVYEGDMATRAGSPSFMHDDPELAGHFIVWACSDEAAFLSGKYVWANWDAGELLAHKVEIEKQGVLETGLGGWEFAPPRH